MAASDDDEIPETGAIFTFGKTRFAENLANKFWIRDDKVLHLACGDEHSAVITNTGRLYTFGSNDWGQLGHGNNKPYTKPGVVKKLKGDKVKFVACGRSHTLVISESGVYSFGAGADSQLGHGDNQSCNVPTQIEALENKRISKVACGAEHSAALTENGELYTWGSGSEGQLGLGLPDSELPTKLKLQEQIIDVACGYYHTAIVTDDGKLFTFGDDEGGKLGLDDDQCNDTEEPQHVRTISEHVVSVACGGNHTAAVTSRGTLYTFGNGMHGQLGHGPQLLEAPLPTPVAALRRKCVTGVACGESHTAAFTKTGELYTCGDGRHGKLGMGDDSFSNLFKPEKVVRFKSFHVVYVACGGCHMLVVATRNTQDDRDSEGSEEEDDVVQTSPVKDKNQDQWGAKDEVDGPKPPPRLSSTLPLSASMSARDKRRQKDIENTMLTGSLPPLNRSSLPPLASLGLSNVKKEDTSAKPAANGGFNPLDKSTLPTISLKEPSPDENNDSHEEQQPAAKPSSARRLPPRPKKRQKKPVQTHHSDSDEDEEHNTSRSDASSPTRRPKPLPRKQKGNKTQNKEASLAENSKKSPPKMPAGRSAGSEASDEDSGDDERSYRSSPGKNGDGPGTSRSLAETKKSEKIAVDHEKRKEKEEDSEEEDDSEEDEVEEIVNDGKEKSKDGKKEEEKEDEDEDEDSEDDEEEDSTKDSKASSASKKSETKVEQEDSGEEDVKDKDKKKKGKDKEKRKKNEESENEDTKEDDGKTKKKDKKKDKTKGKKEDDRDDDDEEQTNNNKSGKNKKKQKGKKKAESEEEDDDDGEETEETEDKKDEKKDEDKENEKEENVDGKTEEEGNKKDEKTDGKKSKKSGVCVLL